jgi:F-type H+-transporting ATPase subunit epsilon
MTSFQLTIITPEKVIFNEPVVSLIVPGQLGYLGLLANHAPLMTSLVPGKLTLRKGTEGQQTIVMALDGGFLEFANNQATLLADGVTPRDQIDVVAEKVALESIHRKLQSLPDNPEELKKQLELIQNRLKIRL